MIARCPLPLALALFSMTFACGSPAETPLPDAAKQIIQGAQRLTLYSVEAQAFRDFGYGKELEPSLLENSIAALEERDGVVGSVEIADAEQRSDIVKAFVKGYGKDGPVALCYDPHHVLAFQSGDAELHVHLCFRCNYAVVIGAGTKHGAKISFQDKGGLRGILNRILAASDIAIEVEHNERPDHERDQATLDRVISPATQQLLASADDVRLFSIDPLVYDDWGRGRHDDPFPLATALATLESGEGVHGSTPLRRPNTRAATWSAVFAGIRADVTPAKCYEPRHALVARHDGEIAIVFLCFACNYIVVLDESTEAGHYQPFGDQSGLKERLNDLLRVRSVPIDGEKRG